MKGLRGGALVLLWLQAAALLGLAGYTLQENYLTGLGLLSVFKNLLAALVAAWWTQLFAIVTAEKLPQPNLQRPLEPWEEEVVARGKADPRRLPPLLLDGRWRALQLFYPWLTALRLSFWGLTLLGLLAGMAPTANPVALTALMTVWGGFIWASNATYSGLLKLCLAPENPALRSQLAQWLNLLSALSLAITVMNLLPVAGYKDLPSTADLWVYGVSGVLNVLAALLAYATLQSSQNYKSV